MSDIRKIKKIQLSDDTVYYLYDADALHLRTDGNLLLTGNLIVDKKITANNLSITHIDDRPIAVENVLTQSNDGNIQKRSADNLLEDIGGISYSINNSSGLLAFKYGKQNS